MTDKTQAKLKDDILYSLSKKRNSCSGLAKSLNQSFETIYALSQEIGYDGYIHVIDAGSKDGPELLLSIEPEGTFFLSNSSYSSLLDSEKVAQKKTARRITTADVINIGIAIIFGISAAVLGWLNYIDNQTIKEQKQEIKDLKKQIEILKNE